MNNLIVPVITIDGPSGAGKGTVSQILSEKLGWNLLDSGSLYRIVAYAILKNHINLDDQVCIEQLIKSIDITYNVTESSTEVLLDDKNITNYLRDEKIGETASVIAANEIVRGYLIQKQKDFAKPPGLIADGRDMGTVIFPNALLKIFLDASPEERARRRTKQLQDKGLDVNIDEILANIIDRDQRDRNRSISPLVPADNAIVIDSTNLSINDVVSYILESYALLRK
ncbi:cytidylate kinase [Paraphotobacterium marinum]|uniref:Cytidylate kinase n=1 Tax=Paraphotobacterium marinum TaxID=1755811 RepID=A0A220VDZ0_9GAMM|nr:(d)CMP kinase [Paraphotobacterium marinum]ASK78614.1 cytidylate kinase [Paraphotobacterium marinum]